MELLTPDRFFNRNEKNCAFDLNRFGVFCDGFSDPFRPKLQKTRLFHAFSKDRIGGEDFFQDLVQGVHSGFSLGKSAQVCQNRRLMRLFFCFLLFATSGCGYTLRGNSRVFFDQNGIKALYVAPVKNDSFKAGVEIIVYNALRKRIAQGGYVRIVDQKSLADGEVRATVGNATYSPAGITTADQLAPVQTGPSNIQIASAYLVNLTISFEMESLRERRVLWSDSITRQKSFSASTYLGALGTTSALINESDFERTLGELSSGIVMDAEESMNSIF
jgi:hypothetical protein